MCIKDKRYEKKTTKNWNHLFINILLYVTYFYQAEYQAEVQLQLSSSSFLSSVLFDEEREDIELVN